MNISFIKWMCEKAGWEFMGNESHYHVSVNIGKWTNNGDYDYRDVYYPLLLQRAIEGVNNENGNYLITQDRLGIMVNNEYNVNISYVDQAKKSALKYIFEQEKDL